MVSIKLKTRIVHLLIRDDWKSTPCREYRIFVFVEYCLGISVEVNRKMVIGFLRGYVDFVSGNALILNDTNLWVRDFRLRAFLCVS